MVYNHAIVYNLQPENRFEVDLIYDMDDFLDPIKFCMSGFEYKTHAKSLVVNKD